MYWFILGVCSPLINNVFLFANMVSFVVRVEVTVNELKYNVEWIWKVVYLFQCVYDWLQIIVYVL